MDVSIALTPSEPFGSEVLSVSVSFDPPAFCLFHLR